MHGLKMTELINQDNQLLHVAPEVFFERARRTEDIRVRYDEGKVFDEASTVDGSVSDYSIVERLPFILPFDFTSLISLKSRDEGNALIEETRILNNGYIGVDFSYLEAILPTDIVVIDLSDRAKKWAENVCTEVLYRFRNKLKEEPVKVYVDLYRAMKPLWKYLSERLDGLFPLVWLPALHMIPHRLLDSIFIKTGNLVIDGNEAQLRRCSGRKGVVGALIDGSIVKHLRYFGVMSAMYTEKCCLDPLLGNLKECSPLPNISQVQATYQRMVNDILDAYPYVSLDEKKRVYAFAIPGAEKFGSMAFLGRNGCALIGIDDSEMTTPLKAMQVRGSLTLGWDGKLSFGERSWQTVESTYGYEDGLRLSCWFLEQVHEAVVAHYLRVEPMYRNRLVRPMAENGADGEGPGDPAIEHVSGVREACESLKPEEKTAVATLSLQPLNHTHVPQIRRNLFFKILTHCGVRVEQGKGSEIKLLRAGKEASVSPGEPWIRQPCDPQLFSRKYSPKVRDYSDRVDGRVAIRLIRPAAPITVTNEPCSSGCCFRTDGR